MLSCLRMSDFRAKWGNSDPAVVTLAQALEEFVSVYLPGRNLMARTRVEYRTDVTQLVAFLAAHGIYRLGEIAPNHLHDFLRTIEGQPIQRRKVFALKSFFAFLKHDDMIAEDLGEGLIPPPHHERRLRVLNSQEQRKLREACNHHVRDRALVELLLSTGITLCEVVRLMVYDVDTDRKRGRLHVPGRGYKRRTLPLDAAICQTLDAWLVRRPGGTELALFTNRFQKTLGERSIQSIVRKYLVRVGIGGASVSTLRHTYAVNQLLHSVDLATLQNQLGLANRQDVEPYVSVIWSN